MVGYFVSVTIFTALYALFSLGLNLQWGLTGLINFGHVAFMTIGAYVTVLLNIQGVPLIVALVTGTLVAATLGLIIGTSTLRLREDYLAIVTIGVAELLRLIANNERWPTPDGPIEGSFGLKDYLIPLADWDPNLWQKLIAIAILTVVAVFAMWQLWRGLKTQWKENQQIQDKSYRPRKPITLIIWGAIGTALIVAVYINGTLALYDYYYRAGLMVLVLLVLALVYWGLEILVRSPWGRIIKAIREDEEIPRVLGKNVFWYKLQAFMLGGAIAGIAGAFYAWYLTTVYPSNFESIVTFYAWTIIILGGAGSNAGTLVGALIFSGYNEITRNLFVGGASLDALRIMIMGLIVMILMIWRPQGILGKKEELTLGK